MTLAVHIHEQVASARSVRTQDSDLPISDLLERLQDPQTRAAMHQLLDGVTALHMSGGLQTVFEGLGVVHAFRTAATETLIDNLAQCLETAVSLMGNPGVASLARKADDAVAEAAQYAASPLAPTNLWGLLRVISRPETMRGLTFLLGLCQEFQRSGSATGKTANIQA